MKKFFQFLRRSATAATPIHSRAGAATGSETEFPADQYLLSDSLSDSATSILVLADGPGATQTISFEIPLRRLRKSALVSLAIVTEKAFEGMTPRGAAARLTGLISERAPKVIIASRFAGLCAHAAPVVASAAGARLIAHLDDDLFTVPPELGAAKFEKYADPARKNRLRLLCERAASVYVSTAPLKRRLEELGVATPICAGEIYCPALAEPCPYRPDPEKPVFGYMGSSGHAADLQMIAAAVEDVLELRPNARFETFGSIKAPQSMLKRFPGRVVERKAAGSYEEFLSLMPSLHWNAGLAPIAATPFNACKADTKFVEYSMAGVPSVLSDFTPYHVAASGGRGRFALTRESWTAAILELLDNPAEAARQTKAAQEWLQSAYSVEKLETQLIRILGLNAEGAVAQPSNRV